jgi:ATP-dependent RNA helicase DeaD
VAAAVAADEAPAVPKKERGKPGAIAMQPYRIEIGNAHGVKPANIVGAIANEAGLEAKYIGRIEIFENYSLLDLPAGMPTEVFDQLKTVAIGGQPLRISHSGVAPVQESSISKKITLTAPNKGGDRRVAEKARSGAKPPSKRAGGNFSASAGKPKTHRKA